MPDQISFQGTDCRFGRFTAAAHFTEASESVIGFYFDNGSNKSAPVASVGVAQRRV